MSNRLLKGCKCRQFTLKKDSILYYSTAPSPATTTKGATNAKSVIAGKKNDIRVKEE